MRDYSGVKKKKTKNLNPSLFTKIKWKLMVVILHVVWTSIVQIFMLTILAKKNIYADNFITRICMKYLTFPLFFFFFEVTKYFK